MKQRILIVYVLAAVLLLTACGSKTALTNDQFIEKMEAAGYQIQDAIDQFGEDVLESATLAMMDDKYQIEFYVLPTSDQAAAAFSNNKSNFQLLEDAAKNTSSLNTNTYNYYALTTNEGYYVVSRIDNTLLYVQTSAEYKDEIKKIIKELGY